MPEGATVAVVGSLPKLGEWDPAKASSASSMDKKVWSTLVQLPSSMARKPIEFKAIMKHKNGNVEWEAGENRVLDP